MITPETNDHNNSEDESFSAWQRRLLTHVAAYAYPSITNSFLKEARPVLIKQAAVSEALFIPYFPPSAEVNGLDSDPRFGLMSYRREEYDFTTAQTVLETLTEPDNRAQLRMCFDYAKKETNDHALLRNAEKWLTEDGLGRSRSAKSGNEKHEIARLTHHHMLVLQTRVPMPGYLSADWFRCLFAPGETQGNLASVVELKIDANDELHKWRPTWIFSESLIQEESSYREQKKPTSQDFLKFSKLFQHFVAWAFRPNGEFAGKLCDTPKATSTEKFFQLGIPLFQHQWASDNKWIRTGSFLGFILLYLGEKPQPNQLRQSAKNLALLPPAMNEMAHRIQSARENEFWRLRVPADMDARQLEATLQDYALAFCGARATRINDEEPSVSTAEDATEWFHIHSDAVPRFSWPQKSPDGLRPSAWKLEWLKTTSFGPSFDAAKDSEQEALVRFQEAQLRLIQIEKMQKLQRDLAAGDLRHDFSRTWGALGVSLEPFERLPDKLAPLLGGRKGKANAALKRDLDRVRHWAKHSRRAWRFMEAHMRTKNARILRDEPAECFRHILKGSKADLLKVIEDLVWLPRDPAEIEKARGVSMESESAARTQDWARLFAYEERGNQNIGELLSRLFCMTMEQNQPLATVFRAPVFNPGQSLDESIYTDPKAIPLHPPPGLLHLLVFSLRTAYRSAYLAGLCSARDAANLSALAKQHSPSVVVNASWDRKLFTQDYFRFVWNIFYDLPDSEGLDDHAEKEWSDLISGYEELTVWKPTYIGFGASGSTLPQTWRGRSGKPACIQLAWDCSRYLLRQENPPLHAELSSKHR